MSTDPPPGWPARATPAVAAAEEDLLNRIVAIRAAAEILDDNQALAQDDRQLFLAVIRDEALQLQHIVRAMMV